VAYQNPAFVIRHYGSEIGVGAISSSVAAAAGFGKERLIDYRLANNFKFSTSAAAHWIEYDMNALGGATINRIIIPAGHTLSGLTLTVKSGASTPPTTTRGSAVATAGMFDLSLTSSTDRYWRLEFSGTGQWELPELWLGFYEQTTSGPTPQWENSRLSPAVVEPYMTREAVLVAGPSRRLFTIEHQWLVLPGDGTIYGNLLLRGFFAPFWFYPTDSVFGGPFLVRLTEDGGREQDHPVPQIAMTYTVKIRMLEQTS